MELNMVHAKEELDRIYKPIAGEIVKRLKNFKEIGRKGNGKIIFKELAFCLLTPASKAKNAWNTIELLHNNGLLYNGKENEIANYLNTVRFKNNKAKNIILARSIFFKDSEFQFDLIFNRFKDDSYLLREWLVRNIRGIAYKESTHFLRNIGRSGELCILDRHILKNLAYYGVIEDIPLSLSKKKYLYIEKRMQEFSKLVGIPLAHLDLLLWYKETGEIFK